MKNLVSIEAPGKKATIEKIIRDESILDDFSVIATSGQIFNLPSHKVGINYKTFEEDKVPRKNYVNDMIARKVAEAENVYLMMDNDDIGEQICRDVVELTSLHHYYRVRFNNLTSDSIRKAFQNLETCLDRKMIESSDARRIINRTLGFNVVSRDNGIEMKAPFGSVATPIISALSSRDVEIGELTLYSNDSLPMKFKAGLKPYAFKNKDVIKMILLNALMKSEKNEVFSDKQDIGVKQLNYHDAIKKANSALQQDTKTTEKQIQRIYESGKISYARTGSRDLPKEEVLEREELWRKFNNLEEKEVLESQKDELDELVAKRDPHPCIYPTTSDINLYEDIDHMDSESAILTLIGEHHLFASQSNLESKVLYKQFSLSDSEKADLVRLGVIFYDDDFYFKVKVSKQQRSAFEKVYDEDIDESSLITKAQYKKSIKDIPLFSKKTKEEVILDIMDSMRIGKPSTIGYHTTRISQFFDDDLTPNGLAKAGYAIAREKLPLLLDVNNAKILEDIIEDDTTTLYEKVSKGLSVYGLDINDLVDDRPEYEPSAEPSVEVNNPKNSPSSGTDFQI